MRSKEEVGAKEARVSAEPDLVNAPTMAPLASLAAGGAAMEATMAPPAVVEATMELSPAEAGTLAGAAGQPMDATAALPPEGMRSPPPKADSGSSTAPRRMGPKDRFKPGTYINQYEIIRELGSGGMGTVYLARDTRLGRRVAIKFLQASNPELTQRFILEAQATARCSHENIVIIYEVGEYQGSPFMVLEYLQGQSLAQVLKGHKRMPPARAVELIVPVVRALQCAHEQGIVHRDLKPDNILVTDTGTLKVLDFGIAKMLQHDERLRALPGGVGPAEGEAEGERRDRALDAEALRGDAHLTRRGAILGTLAYMSPEQWGVGEIDHRTDIWAVGIMLFSMLAGKHPLAHLEGIQLATAATLVDEPMPSIAKATAGIPQGLSDLVDRCLRKRSSERFADARSLLKALEPFRPGRYTRTMRAVRMDESPYAGLSSFQEADADRFYGRSREIAAMVARIGDRPLMAVVGPSGIGKSSFIRAGVVPTLKQSGESWEAMVLRPGRDPLAALASLLMPLVSSSTTLADDVQQQRALVERLHAEPGYLGVILRRRAQREGHRVLLFIDQFEELYTLTPDERERLAFTTCLAGVADDVTAPTRVVVSIRSDFLDRVSEDQHFMAELSQGLFFLSAPQRDGLRDALVQPAEGAGYHFESPEMVEEMLDHLEATDGALPLLQFTVAKLWDARDNERKLLTMESYRGIGGIGGALASHADSVLAELPAPSRAVVRDLFLRLVTPENTRAIVSLAELRELGRDPAEVQRLVDLLAQARLLVVQTSGDAAGATVELIHESLIHRWPTLRRWLDESHEDSMFLEQLRTAARQWQAKGSDSGLLWRGETVEEARRFLRRYRGELPGAQRAFLEAVFDLDARAVRRRRALFLGAGVTLVGLLAAASVALLVIRDSQLEAKHQAETAQKAEATARTAAEVAQRAEAAARAAEAEARQRLEEVQTKERERQRAETAKTQAEQAVAVANTQVELTQEEIKKKNQELLAALQKAEQARQRAEAAQMEAEESAATARKAKQQAEALLHREQDRVKRLQQQLGSSVIDNL
jgi:serine/threonine protein kinase